MVYTLTDCPPDKIVQGAIKQAPDEVKALQDLVGAKPDGIFGEKTKKAIWDKYGDVTNPKVFESLPEDIQQKFAEFDKAIGGSKGYFQKPEVCVVEGAPDIVLPDMPGKEGLLHSSGPEAVERPMPRPAQEEPIELYDKQQSDFGKDRSGWGKGDFTIIPTPAEPEAAPVDKGLLHSSPPGQTGLAQIDPVKPDLPKQNPHIAAHGGMWSASAAEGPMGIVSKELPANLSGISEPSAQANLKLSTTMGNAGIADQGMYDKITSAEKSGWKGADGPNTEVAGSWDGNKLSSMFESAVKFVKDTFTEPEVANAPSAPATHFKNTGMGMS